MKKLKLDLDSLRVDTFTASSRSSGTGTVRGYDSTMGLCTYQDPCQPSYHYCTESVSGMVACICDTGVTCDRC